MYTVAMTHGPGIMSSNDVPRANTYSGIKPQVTFIQIELIKPIALSHISIGSGQGHYNNIFHLRLHIEVSWHSQTAGLVSRGEVHSHFLLH